MILFYKPACNIKSSHPKRLTMKTTVSIDRITIVGNISDMTLEIQQKLSPLYRGFNLDDIVFVEPLGKGKWRLDFNPNHLNITEDTILFLRKLKNKKITRLDVAFDVFDFPQFMSLRYNAADASERWFSRSKSLEQSTMDLTNRDA